MATAAVPSIRFASPDLAIPFLSSTRRINAKSLLRSVEIGNAPSKGAVFAAGNLGALKGGAGVLERPSFDQSQFDPVPQLQEGGDIGRSGDKKRHGSGDSYRVLLVDDLRHTEKLVEKALPEVVPSVSVSEARKLFHESRKNGVAIVIVTVRACLVAGLGRVGPTLVTIHKGTSSSQITIHPSQPSPTQPCPKEHAEFYSYMMVRKGLRSAIEPDANMV